MPISTKSNDTPLQELLREIHQGTNQLPEFQRSWIWDDARIRGILASISQGYPVGAILRLKYGNPKIQFKYRPLEGVDEKNVKGEPEYLILDGQQRLTSIYQATFSENPVKIESDRKNKGKEKALERRYYLLMEKCLEEKGDRLDAVISVPADKILRKNFDRDIELDLSTDEKEYEAKAFPLNIVFESNKLTKWIIGYAAHYSGSTDDINFLGRFRAEVIDTIVAYTLPVITIPKEAPREAVCKVFENVNTGGVSLTVFELLTAIFATHEGFNLRDDWEECRKIICGEGEPLNTDLFEDIDDTTFLTAVTLYTSYMNKLSGKSGAVSCKKNDVLDLDIEDYKNNRLKVAEGFVRARNFLLNHTYVFRKRDLPYPTQMIPLAAICTVLGNRCTNPDVEALLKRWFWCGILGEVYSMASETRYANDIEDVMGVINGDIEASQIRTINSALFSATRLLTLQKRNSAAYKGILALLYMNKCQDFISSLTIDKLSSMSQSVDIHHIFPAAYCDNMKIEYRKHNSIVNKTPILYSTNRKIGGRAPKDYLELIKKDNNLSDSDLRSRVESHFIDYDLLSNNDFDKYFIDRAKKLLTLIEEAMDKKVTDRDSDETIREFGESLA